jgi:hypothetical protein
LQLQGKQEAMEQLSASTGDENAPSSVNVTVEQADEADSDAAAKLKVLQGLHAQ